MKEKAKIVIEFQADDEHKILMAINYIRFAVFDVRGKIPVIVNIEIPKKYTSHSKS